MWVVRLEGDKFHSAWENFEDADNELKFLSSIGITTSFKFEDFIKDEILDSSICNEREQFANKMLQIIRTKAFKDFYSGNWHFLNDEEVIKEIQKLF